MEVGGVQEWVDIAKAQEKGVTEASGDGLLATFYRRPVENKAKTRVEGRPIFDGIPFVKILIPGQNKSEVDRKVKDEDKRRWPEAWKRFEANEESVLAGTPLEEWAFLTSTRVMELKALNIRTVEQLANVSDGLIPRLGPDGRALVRRAAEYLTPQSEVETELREQADRQEREISALKALVEQQQKILEEKPKRGRPKKT